MTEPIFVDLTGGACPACRGRLCVLDADDATMTLECQECGQAYLVEPDTIGDVDLVYSPANPTPLKQDRSQEDNRILD